MTRRKVLAVTTSPLPYRGQITDGPGYRMWNLLRTISPDHEVRVLSLYESFHMGQRGLDPVSENGIVIERSRFSPSGIATRVRAWAPDVLYLPWSSLPFIGDANRDVPTLLDYVGPGLLEEFVGRGRVPLALLRLQLRSFWAGDRFLTTTQRERYYLIGLLAASKRLSTGDFRPDDPLVHLARITPPPEPEPPSAREALPPKHDDELVVLVAGAFLPWYDYQRLVDAALQMEREGSRIRLLVIGGNPRNAEAAARIRTLFDGLRARSLAEVHDLVPFDQRGAYYAAADVGLIVPPNSVEDELSARTRIVDYLWARLPIVSPGKDEYSALVLDASAGFRYDPEAGGIPRVLGHLAVNRVAIADAKSRIPSLVEGPFDPRTALKPAMDFIEDPRITRRTRRRLMPEKVLAELWDLARGVRR